ncbi:hypothetical protein CNMCM7691_009882 [Aspergillus felis]|uniref:Ketosynthase family 3 (KS3) domain-containing protein n=1 Tax=Aspergillus felis TaxID=1287682 RepID=A0A8H6QZ97_9EURO|nr:hypothetical protein CNMCM7691_009882 [Aspergillus felis]
MQSTLTANWSFGAESSDVAYYATAGVFILKKFPLMRELRVYPSLLRPLVGWFLPACELLRGEIAKARTLIEPIIIARRAERERCIAEDLEPPIYLDTIAWAEECARGRKYDPAVIQLTLALSAMHNTSDFLTQVLYDIVARQALVEQLRIEIIDVRTNRGGREFWNKGGVHQLMLMDSVMKESQRLKPTGLVNMRRYATEKICLPSSNPGDNDGLTIEKGDLLMISQHNHWDEEIYPNAAHFDPYRFYKMRQAPTQEHSAHFVATSVNHIGFGHGAHGCPGRFFAAAETKLALCHILMKYDIKLVDQPKVFTVGSITGADPVAKFALLRRLATMVGSPTTQSRSLSQISWDLIRISRYDKYNSFLALFAGVWSTLLAGSTRLREEPSHISVPFILTRVLFCSLAAYIFSGAGMVWNDWVDRDIDARVARTKDRPLAAGRLGTEEAMVWMLFHAGLATTFLYWMMDGRYVLHSMMPPTLGTLIYPYCKRPLAHRMGIYPQYVLALTASCPVLFGRASIYPNLVSFTALVWSSLPLCLVVFTWTLYFNTAYSYQDIVDDKKLGVNSLYTLAGQHIHGVLVALATIVAAIVGTGCRFPGSSSSPARLWDLIQNPRNVASKVPSGRFNVDAFYHPNSQQHGATCVTESYFLEEDVRAFDAPFFNISPAEAAALDPQQRLLLETVYDALDAGGHRLEVLQGSPTGVYCGFLRTDYSQIQFADPDSIPPYTVTGNSPAIMANRISYFFNWIGPSFSVDTGCSSSLLAVHLAVEGLRKGDCAMAVAVGSNLILSPNPYIADAKTGMLSATGRSKMWDASADGYARGEGVASVVLKRLSDAIAAGDDIECVIRATGVNSDGRTMGITMPNGEAQQQLIESTYASIGLDPKNAQHRCQYFEAHGTGTQAGDPQEASAIYGAFFGDAALEDSQVLHVGSIKSVIGHTEATAGLAGLIKASLCLQHGEIAPNLLLSAPNPRIVPYLSRLRVPDERVPWPSLPPGVPRRASVNSFGFGGANVHAILESYAPPSSALRRKEYEVGPWLLPFAFSAASELSLGMVLKDLLQLLDDNPMINLMDLALTLMTQRSCHKYRVMFTATSADELRDHITQEIFRQSSGHIPANLRRHVQFHLNSRTLGIFTGQGAQWPQMGLDLIRASPQAQIWMADMQQSLNSLPLQYRPNFDLMTELAAPDPDSRIHEASVSQPLRTAIQIVQSNLLRKLGLKFDTVIGHSSGEIAAAYAAGMLDLADTIRVAYLRGWAIQQSQNQQNPGSMIAVMLNWKQAEAICNLPQYVGKIQIAAYNSPTSVTLSGDREAIDN